MAVLIGDVRRRGRYTAVIKDILNFPQGEIRSIIKVQHNCTSDRKAYGKMEDPPIKHEYCVVFKKTGVGEGGEWRGGAAAGGEHGGLGVATEFVDDLAE